MTAKQQGTPAQTDALSNRELAAERATEVPPHESLVVPDLGAAAGILSPSAPASVLPYLATAATVTDSDDGSGNRSGPSRETTAASGRSPGSGTYWEAYQPAGQLTLSPGGQLSVSRVMKGGQWFMRLYAYPLNPHARRGSPTPRGQVVLVPLELSTP